MISLALTRLKSKDMKAYTDIEQSKKLAEILPVESADMWWNTEKHYPEFVKTYREHLGEQISPIPNPNSGYNEKKGGEEWQ